MHESRAATADMAAQDTLLLLERAGEIDRRGAVAFSLPVLPPRRGKILSHHATGGTVSAREKSKIRTGIGFAGKGVGSCLVTTDEGLRPWRR